MVTVAPVTVTLPVLLPMAVFAVPVVLMSVFPTTETGEAMLSNVLLRLMALAPEVRVTLPVPAPPMEVLASPVVLMSVLPTTETGEAMLSNALLRLTALAPEVRVTLPVPAPPMEVLERPLLLMDVVPIMLIEGLLSAKAVALCKTAPFALAINPLMVAPLNVPL